MNTQFKRIPFGESLERTHSQDIASGIKKISYLKKLKEREKLLRGYWEASKKHPRPLEILGRA